MKFKQEISPRIIDLDAICFPEPPHTSILEFKEGEEKWHNFNIYALCDDENKLISYAAWGCPWDNQTVYLCRYGTKPEHRRLGFGFLLLTYSTSEIRKSYQGIIYADVRSENTTSRNLFRKKGWTEYAEYDGEYDAENAVRVIHSIPKNKEKLKNLKAFTRTYSTEHHNDPTTIRNHP